MSLSIFDWYSGIEHKLLPGNVKRAPGYRRGPQYEKIHLYTSKRFRSLTTDSPTMSMTIPSFTNTLGPLPTSWAPPASCSIGLAGNNHEAWLDQYCHTGTARSFDGDTSCWPPRSEGAGALSGALSLWGVYSPGIACPIGMTSACGFDGSRNTGNSQFYFHPGPSETAIGCCPSSVIPSFRSPRLRFLFSTNVFWLAVG